MRRLPKTTLGLLLQAFLWALLLVGWGLDDVGGFFAHPARTGLLLVALAGTVIVLVSGADLDPFRKGEKKTGHQAWFVAVFLVVTLFAVCFLPFADRRSVLVFAENDSLRYAGLALNVIGTAIRVAGLLTLGRQFSGYITVQENHQLVQTGIYGRIRHPMYLGVLLAFPGFALTLRSQLTIPLFVIFAVLIRVRLQREEKLLGEHFGAEFDAYQRRTWRLVPYLY
ncbi:MAG: isoprenylcysteine carboxylmethyltransferase family protein [Acidobacteria bacterium]|nr:isoprenylcysteine carboxylmethyltransferase family protein [Acidobacteriota bacterium]